MDSLFMDFHMKQWRDHQDESEEQPSAPPKMPKLLLQPPHQLFQNQRQEASSASALPLFVPEAPSSTKISSHLSAQPDSTPATTTTTKLPRVGGYFSLAQWQELELQALIYRHMVSGAAIPPELLQLVKKSLLNSPYFLHHTIQHNLSLPYFHPTRCWLRAAMDPEPGRCRRTDGKKWRCSRDVVAGQKYCERHMHRGRSRSRKPVEFPVPTATATSAAATSVLADGGADAARGVGGGGVSVVGPTSAAAAAVPCDSIFSLSGTTASVDTLHFNQGSSESRPVKKKGPFEPQHEASDDNDRVLRHFFDDWPRSIQDTNATGSSSRATSAMHLSISAPGNPCPDFLKLSTGGNEDEPGGRPGLHWTAAGWAAGGGSGQATPVGGPLAEALRSSSNSSPTSVLHQTLRCTASGSRFVST